MPKRGIATYSATVVVVAVAVGAVRTLAAVAAAAVKDRPEGSKLPPESQLSQSAPVDPVVMVTPVPPLSAVWMVEAWMLAPLPDASNPVLPVDAALEIVRLNGSSSHWPPAPLAALAASRSLG